MPSIDRQAPPPAASQPDILAALGWRPFFADQVEAGSNDGAQPVRVVEAHRGALHVLGEGVDRIIPGRADVVVGDWLLLDPVEAAEPATSRLLERKSLIKRRAPGLERQVQMIAANIDTAFIVSSCNQDFNVARLERYIALAFEAGVTPVVLLTKADLCDDPAAYVEAAQAIAHLAPVLVLNARLADAQSTLATWCAPGQTVAFLGSSGVGKSTLANTLAGNEAIETQAIREGDAKGRHTTTRRQLHLPAGGYAILDTPGMRELQLTGAEAGVAEVFADLHALAGQCRFNDCQHRTEPGCAVRAGVGHGSIENARLERWMKLVAEDKHNTANLTPGKANTAATRKADRRMRKKSRS